MWHRLPPRVRWYWLHRERFWFYAGIAFWIGAPAYIVYTMARAA